MQRRSRVTRYRRTSVTVGFGATGYCPNQDDEERERIDSGKIAQPIDTTLWRSRLERHVQNDQLALHERSRSRSIEKHPDASSTGKVVPRSLAEDGATPPDARARESVAWPAARYPLRIEACRFPAPRAARSHSRSIRLCAVRAWSVIETHPEASSTGKVVPRRLAEDGATPPDSVAFARGSWAPRAISSLFTSR